jgi:hypothetical protein
MTEAGKRPRVIDDVADNLVEASNVPGLLVDPPGQAGV